jgi:hypothetical protein
MGRDATVVASGTLYQVENARGFAMIKLEPDDFTIRL